MKILKRLLPFARPLHHFIPEYVTYTLLAVIFGLLNFALLIPVLGLLFEKEAVSTVSKPEFSLSLDYIKAQFNYTFYSIIQQHGKFMALLFVCAVIGASILLANVFRYLAVKTLIRLRLKLMGGLRNAVYEKYVYQSLHYHHNSNKGALLQVISGETQEIESSVINSLQVLLRDPVLVLAYFGLLFYWSPVLTLFTLIFLPVTGITIALLTRRLKKMNYFSQDMIGKMISTTDETLSGIKPIQSFTAERTMLEKFKQLNHTFSVLSKNLFSKKEFASPISEVLGVFAALMLVLFGGYLILENRGTTLSGEQFIAYLALYTQIIQPLKNISQTQLTLQRGIVACEKIFEVLDEPIRITDTQNAVHKNDFTTAISLSNVSFAYQTVPVLHNYNLTIPKGKIVALVGQSGSGKSTLIDLICRFHDVSAGSIEIDGVNIKKMLLHDLRGMIGVVSQDAFLFNETVFNNIALHNPGASMEQVTAAAKIANAHNFITEMENGYNTVVGERGVKLSGGQRQRITIARAILKDPPILILDEATSSLDTESERLVQDAINNLMTNRTSIVIAHRLSTIRHADEIIVMQKGEIVERGTHDELIALNGFYNRLVEMQEVK